MKIVGVRIIVSNFGANRRFLPKVCHTLFCWLVFDSELLQSVLLANPPGAHVGPPVDMQQQHYLYISMIDFVDRIHQGLIYTQLGYQKVHSTPCKNLGVGGWLMVNFCKVYWCCG